jgi:hypothetical protein
MDKKIISLRMERQYFLKKANEEEYIGLYRDTQPGQNVYWNGFGQPPTPLQYLLIDGEFHGASVGHFRNGPYDLNDVVCDLPDAMCRKGEILEAVRAANFGKEPDRFMGGDIRQERE